MDPGSETRSLRPKQVNRGRGREWLVDVAGVWLVDMDELGCLIELLIFYEILEFFVCLIDFDGLFRHLAGPSFST